MKRVFQVCAVMAAVAGAAGSARAEAAWQVGFKGGVSIQELDGDSVDDDLRDSRTAFAGGVFGQVDLTRNLGLRFEGLYFMKGASGDSASIDVDFQFDYLEFPILLLGHLPLSDTARLTVFGGPTFGFNTAAEIGVTYAGVSGGVGVGEFVKGFEFGLTFGAGLSFDVGAVVLGFDGRYGLGLTSVDDGLFVEPGDASNRGFAVMAGLGFPIAAE